MKLGDWSASNIRHFLGDLNREDAKVFAFDPDSGGYYELAEITEQHGHAVIRLGAYQHSFPWTDPEPGKAGGSDGG